MTSKFHGEVVRSIWCKNCGLNQFWQVSLRDGEYAELAKPTLSCTGCGHTRPYHRRPGAKIGSLKRSRDRMLEIFDGDSADHARVRRETTERYARLIAMYES